MERPPIHYLNRFGGDPAPNSANLDTGADADTSVLEQVKLKAAEAVQSFMLDMWLARQTPEKVMPILRKVIEGAKEEFADAIASGGGLYAVGYCFGAKYVLLLGADAAADAAPAKDEEQGLAKAEPIIKVGAIAHGTLIEPRDLENVKVPITMVCVGKSSRSFGLIS